MTAMPDKCPRCGSPHKERWGCADHFQCGSYIRLFDRRFRDSEGCVRRQLEAARAETDRLRQMIGECHLMISRGTDEFQTKHDWEATDLPKRLQSVMRQNAALRELLQETQWRAKSVVDDLERHQQYCEPQYGKYGQLNCDACDALYELRDILEAVEVSDDA